MKKFVFLYFVASVISAVSLNAQEVEISGICEYADSIVYRPASAVDSTLVGLDVFEAISSRYAGGAAGVRIDQSPVVAASMRAHIASNASRNITGYRVRIFFDNKQTARTESEQTLRYFESMYHDVAAYRTYSNPYFKVTVGDCRTKSEAMALLARIKPVFPGAFVVKEFICYPVVDKDNAYVTDTIKVIVPKLN